MPITQTREIAGAELNELPMGRLQTELDRLRKVIVEDKRWIEVEVFKSCRQLKPLEQVWLFS